MLPSLRRPIAPALLSLALVGCDSPPSASGLREWTPADHDRVEESARAATQRPAAPAAPSAKAPRPARDASGNR